ncbi:hypothetical protein ARMGADRAFT_1075403 [Armillaria gallica]|uniref:DUF6534 domain-containing protein n=1 Tax=Armillaria gallica TaxID=47427 RepID=A0A2H3DTK7_ARMGA|nr:hypothetical protein ARMGADRAFT_1075403 [Armillaria gallica]
MSNDHTQFGVPTGYSSVFYGYVLSIVLFGITLVQAWNYITTNSDNWPTRVFVALLLGIDSATTSLSIQIMHHYLISNFGNPDSLKIMTSFDAQLGITVIVIFMVDVFFAVNIYRRRPRNWSLPIVILVFAVAGLCEYRPIFVKHCVVIEVLAFGSAFVANCALRPEVGTAGNVQKANIASIHATATATSLMITIGLALSQSRECVLHKFFTYSINHGVLMTAAQAITVFLYAIDASKLYWMALYLGMNKLYIISVVATLNYESRFGVDARVDISIGNTAVNDTSNQDGAASANTHSTNINLLAQHTIDLSQTKQDTRENAESSQKVALLMDCSFDPLVHVMSALLLL